LFGFAEVGQGVRQGIVVLQAKQRRQLVHVRYSSIPIEFSADGDKFQVIRETSMFGYRRR
jgi:hypothetical protein